MDGALCRLVAASSLAYGVANRVTVSLVPLHPPHASSPPSPPTRPLLPAPSSSPPSAGVQELFARTCQLLPADV